jgi:competence protein ComEC
LYSIILSYHPKEGWKFFTKVLYLLPMASAVVYFWKKIPFLRLLLPLAAGIILQWHFQFSLNNLWLLLIVFLLILAALFFIPFFERFRFSFLGGLSITMIFMAAGAILTWHRDIRNDNRWLGHHYQNSDNLVVTLAEPLVEKTKSFKADAEVNVLIRKETAIPVKGKIIIYFSKDTVASPAGSSLAGLTYGTQLLIAKPLQEIKNSGNPGGFDYTRYCLFNDIAYQVFLKPEEFVALPGKNEKWLGAFLISIRKEVLRILRTNIKGEKELGLAEALLIGYKNDLDKNLVQSYTNTGVVHIIAISGLHLGLIYWLLVQIFMPLQKRKEFRWLRPLLIITGLWLFALLAGSQPSIVRSAAMFTCVVIGDSFFRKGNIFNTLAFSAFILLCWNPFWLWDVGFQLSYAAVLSIVIFMRPVYNLLYVKNKLLDFFWKLNAVTIAAQVLTLPVSVYHFHQFPSFFMLTNFVAVPLASTILIGEIFLCAISFIPFLAGIAGSILSWLIWCMNSYIESVEALPYSLWDGLQITILQAVVLFFLIAGWSYWLLEKSRQGFYTGFVALLAFVMLRSSSFLQSTKQKKIIVYNVPQRQAIDFVDGRNYYFHGDADLLKDDFLRNFHLKPSRILHRITPKESIGNLYNRENYFLYYNKRILLLDETVSFQQPENKIPVDLLLISKNPRLYFNTLSRTFDIKQVVFDGSVPAWKMRYWKKDCDSLGIPYHDVNEKGAFVMNLR